MRLVAPEPLTAEAFEPFGEVISTEAAERSFAINYGATTRFHDLAQIDVGPEKDGGRVIASIFRSTPLPTPVVIKLLERHPLGSQAFMPLNGRPYLVVVAPPGELNLSEIRVFLARGDQGVNYAPGTWHHYSLALEGPSDFLVIDRAGEGTNLDEVELAEPDRIAIDV
jgi:ureidoglycolate lyase